MILNLPLCDFPKGLKSEFESAVVDEPSVFEPLKFYCAHRGYPIFDFTMCVCMYACMDVCMYVHVCWQNRWKNE